MVKKLPLKFLVLGAGFVLLALGLRLVFLNSLPIFADESIYIHWAQIMRSEPTLRFLPLSDGKQPLFMWAIIPFMKFISDPLIAGRVFSAFVGFATAPLVGLAYYLLFKKVRPSLLAALLWWVVPFTVFFNRMALVDSLLVFFIMAAFDCLLVSFIYCRWDFSMLAGFALGAAWLTKSPAIFSFVLLPSLLLLPQIDKSKRRNCLLYLGFIMTAYVIAFAMYNILRLGPEFHMIAIRNNDYVFPLSEVLAHPFQPSWSNLQSTLSYFLYYLTPVGLVLAVWGIFSDRTNHLFHRLILSAWWLAPLAAQVIFARNLTARYLLFTVPFAILLATHAIEHIASKSRFKYLFYVTAALVIIPALVLDYQLIFTPQSAPLPRRERAGYLEEWTSGVGLREAANQIRTAAAAGPVVVGSEGFFGTPFDALAAYLQDLPQVRVIGVGVWIDSVSDKLTSALDENQVFLVVNSSRFHADYQKLGLELLGAYPKAANPNGDKEALLFFRVTKAARK